MTYHQSEDDLAQQIADQLPRIQAPSNLYLVAAELSRQVDAMDRERIRDDISPAATETLSFVQTYLDTATRLLSRLSYKPRTEIK